VIDTRLLGRRSKTRKNLKFLFTPPGCKILLRLAFGARAGPTMSTEVTTALNALEGFAAHLDTVWSDQPFQTLVGGWNVLPLSRADLVSRVRRLAERLKTIPDDKFNTELLRKMVNLPNQLAWFQNNTLPQLSSGNLPTVVANFEMIMSNIEQSLPIEQLSWEEVEKANLIPRDLARRVRNIRLSLNQLEPIVGELDDKVKRINDAHAAANDLPTDMQLLSDARTEIKLQRDAALALIREINTLKNDSEARRKHIESQEEEATKLVENIDKSYSTSTTAGLGAAFNERAVQLSRSTWIWVIFLFLSLFAGGAVGYIRLNSFQRTISDAQMDPRWIWLDAAMSLLSLAAPIWFAWLSTRQIGQRFRLAEDYGFKASVARAYEGYRRQAARLDPKLESRLFSSALDRLEEAPLRFISVEEHSSPYEALLASAGFQKLIDKLPALDKQTVISILNNQTSEKSKVRKKSLSTDTQNKDSDAPVADNNG
jgi:hypothetical protein